jgi:signal peptidase II
VFTLKNTKMPQWFLISILVLTFDQLSKNLILLSMGMYNKIAILPCLNFSLAYNHGAAFGILANSDGWQKWLFCGIAVIISILIVIWAGRLTNKDYWEGIALASILGGALGNLIDRLRYGHVIDFIDFYIGSWHWYTFNVADIAICVGSAVLLWISFRQR